MLLFQNGFFLPLGFLPIFLAILFLIRGSNIASFGGADDPEIAGVIRGALAWPSNAGFLLLGASMLAVALIGIRFAARNRIIPAFLSIVGAMIVFSVGIDFVLAPRLDRVKSAREISRRADEMVPPEGGGRVSLYPNVYSGALNVYSRRIRMPVLTTPAEVDRFLSAPGKGIIITSRKYLQQDSAKFLAPYVVIDVKRLGSRRMVFLTKPPSLSPE